MLLAEDAGDGDFVRARPGFGELGEGHSLARREAAADAALKNSIFEGEQHRAFAEDAELIERRANTERVQLLADRLDVIENVHHFIERLVELPHMGDEGARGSAQLESVNFLQLDSERGLGHLDFLAGCADRGVEGRQLQPWTAIA